MKVAGWFCEELDSFSSTIRWFLCHLAETRHRLQYNRRQRQVRLFSKKAAWNHSCSFYIMTAILVPCKRIKRQPRETPYAANTGRYHSKTAWAG